MRVLVALLSLFAFPAHAIVTNCWTFPGDSGDYVQYGDVGHFRTGSGQPAWTIGAMVYLGTTAPGSDGWIFESRRASNNAFNHGIQFDDSGNQFSYTYNAAEIFGSTGVNSGQWYLVALAFPGGTGNLTLHVIDVGAGTVVDSDSAASGGSASNDSEAQSAIGGAHYDGSSTGSELNGRMCFQFVIKGDDLSQAELQAYAQDPLNTGDAWVTSYGGDLAMWFDDTGSDQSSNSTSITLNGNVALGSLNGPDIPGRTGGSGGSVRRSLLQRRSIFIPRAVQ